MLAMSVMTSNGQSWLLGDGWSWSAMDGFKQTVA